mgnify:CR=1 FL=1
MKIEVKNNDNTMQFYNLLIGECFREIDTLEPLFIKIRPVHIHLTDGGEFNSNAVNLADGTLESFGDLELVDFCPDATVAI